MSQFDIYPNTRRSGGHAPYLLDLQSNVLDIFTRLVAPLTKPGYFGTPIARLNPRLTVQSEPLILSPTELTSVRTRDLPARIDVLASHRDVIVAALDMLFTGI